MSVSFRPSAAEPEPQTAVRRWSDQQQAVFDWFATGTGNLIVRARAGTGKTTTILEAVSRAPEEPILLAAFNKRIADELKGRLTDSRTEAATLHGIGYRCVRRYWEGIGVEKRIKGESRALDLAERVCGTKMPDAIKRLVAKLHTKGREIRPLAESDAELIDLAVAYDCAPDPEWEQAGYPLPMIAELAYRCMELAAETRPKLGIDFADMLFLPLRNRWVLPFARLVVVDEAQDMSAAQLLLARGSLLPGGRMCVVGDDRQAIYGFRGASSDALDHLKAELQAQELRLTVTYRCGQTIVREAQRLVSDFTAAEQNPQGVVIQGTLKQLLADAQPGDFILSRTNAPLVAVAFALLKQGTRARIEGRDLGQGLLAIVRKVSKGRAANSVPEWLKALKSWEQREVDRADAADLPGKAALVVDQASMLRVLASDVKSVREIETRIDMLFSDDTQNQRGTVVLSSVHKAKGLEANQVWLIASTFGLPASCECGHRHKFGEQRCTKCRCVEYRPDAAMTQEERNIEYVAITRAQSTLIWVTGDPVEELETC